eukprot:3935808-Rhodomonas_salina.1
MDHHAGRVMPSDDDDSESAGLAESDGPGAAPAAFKFQVRCCPPGRAKHHVKHLQCSCFYAPAVCGAWGVQGAGPS